MNFSIVSANKTLKEVQNKSLPRYNTAKQKLYFYRPSYMGNKFGCSNKNENENDGTIVQLT